MGARDLGFDPQVGRIKHSVANGSAPLRHFFGAVLPGAKPLSGPATRYELRHYTAILDFFDLILISVAFRAGAKGGGTGGPAPQSTCLAPPTNKCAKFETFATLRRLLWRRLWSQC